MGGTEGVTIRLDEELSYSLRRQHVDEFVTRQLSSLPAGSRLLDLGGVKRGQRGRSRPALERFDVTVANIVTDKGLDVRADAAWLPLASASFPLVLCSEVLEHVRNPVAVVQQIERVLQPGGSVLITVPFLFRQHADPADYGRYTEWFWRETLQDFGFADIAIEKQGLFGSVLADMLRHWWQQRLVEGSRARRLQRWLLPRLMATARRRALRFDQQQAHHAVWSSYTSGFGIRASKPA